MTRRKSIILSFGSVTFKEWVLICKQFCKMFNTVYIDSQHSVFSQFAISPFGHSSHLVAPSVVLILLNPGHRRHKLISSDLNLPAGQFTEND